MYHKWDNVPKMGHNFLPSSTSFSSSFFRLFFVKPFTTMSAFCPENRPLTSCVLFVHRRRNYHYNDTCFYTYVWYLIILKWRTLWHHKVPKWHKIRWSIVPKRNRIDIFDDGLSSRSMTTTAAKGAINAEKMSQFGAINSTFLREFSAINSHNSQIFQPPVPHIFSFRWLRPPPRSHFSRGFVRFFTHFF